MKYYQEITLIDGDKSLYQLWSDLYTQLHIALVELKNTHGLENVGVSFPNYKYEQKENGKEFSFLGNKLRIFSDKKETLELLDINTKILELNQRQDYEDNADDYFHTKSVRLVPENVDSYLVVSRYRHTPLNKQVANYLAHSKQQGREVSESEAIEHCKQHKQSGRKNYPFINLKSIDNGQNFKLSIKQTLVDEASIGSFNTYGLNTNQTSVTVPHW